MKHKVIIATINISKKGQIHHFQMKLPKTAKHLVAIELGGHLITDKKVLGTKSSSTAFKRNTLVGELKLQSCEKANVFYAGTLMLDNNIGYADFTQNHFWKANSFSHQCQSFQDEILVDAKSTVIQGIYKDNIGKENDYDAQYQIKVYAWYKFENEKTQDQKTK